MSSIIRRNPEFVPASVAPVGEFEPYHMLREMMRWDPFRELTPFYTEEKAAFAPAFEVKETKEAFVFKGDLPGIKEKDLYVTLTGNRLTVSGRREAEKHEEKETYFTYERSYGAFNRIFTLPEGIDEAHVKAELKEGVLTLVVPKLPELQPKKIAVTTMERPKS